MRHNPPVLPAEERANGLLESAAAEVPPVVEVGFQEQGICADEAQWAELLRAMRRNLPLCVRVRRAHPLWRLARAELKHIAAGNAPACGEQRPRACAFPLIDVLRCP